MTVTIDEPTDGYMEMMENRSTAIGASNGSRKQSNLGVSSRRHHHGHENVIESLWNTIINVKALGNCGPTHGFSIVGIIVMSF